MLMCMSLCGPHNAYGYVNFTTTTTLFEISPSFLAFPLVPLHIASKFRSFFQSKIFLFFKKNAICCEIINNHSKKYWYGIEIRLLDLIL